MSHETAFAKSASLGQLKDIVATLVQGVPTGLSSDDAQCIIENKGWLVGEVQELFTLRKLLLDQWAEFYHDAFQLDVNFSALKIPKRVPGFTRLIVVAEGLTLRRVIEVSKQFYSIDMIEPWKYFFCDEENRGKHDRLPTAHYAVWVRDQIDPDVEHADMLPQILKQRHLPCITLLEHLLFHLKYFRESGQLLDRNETATDCFGSRDFGGCIPRVFSGNRRAGKSLFIHHRSYWEYLNVREVVA